MCRSALGHRTNLTETEVDWNNTFAALKAKWAYRIEKTDVLPILNNQRDYLLYQLLGLWTHVVLPTRLVFSSSSSASDKIFVNVAVFTSSPWAANRANYIELPTDVGIQQGALCFTIPREILKEILILLDQTKVKDRLLSEKLQPAQDLLVSKLLLDRDRPIIVNTILRSSLEGYYFSRSSTLSGGDFLDLKFMSELETITTSDELVKY